MKKSGVSILASVILVFLFCVYPLSATVYGSGERITENFEGLYSTIWHPDASKLSDVVVTYKDGTCTVKKMPALKHARFGRTEMYSYAPWGNAGIFLATSVSENSPNNYFVFPTYHIIDTKKSAVTTKAIEVNHDKYENDIYDKQLALDDYEIFSNGVAACYEYPSVILVWPDGSKKIKIDPTTPAGYDFAAFGVDYSAESGLYALAYGLYPEVEYGFEKTKFACVALFDEQGRQVKQFMLDGMFCEPWDIFPPHNEAGYSRYYRYCKSFSDPNALYVGGIVPESMMRKKNSVDWWEWALGDYDYEEGDKPTDWVKEYGAYKYYKINLTDGSIKGVSKPPKDESDADFPFKVQYNTTGTYIYTGSGEATKTLAFLDGDYLASAYSQNLDGSVQIIFVSGAKTDWETHPRTEKKTES